MPKARPSLRVTGPAVSFPEEVRTPSGLPHKALGAAPTGSAYGWQRVFRLRHLGLMRLRSPLLASLGYLRYLAVAWPSSIPATDVPRFPRRSQSKPTVHRRRARPDPAGQVMVTAVTARPADNNPHCALSCLSPPREPTPPRPACLARPLCIQSSPETCWLTPLSWGAETS